MSEQIELLNQKMIDDLSRQAAEKVGNAAVEADGKKKFILLPGDPIKGTVYRGVVDAIAAQTVSNEKAPNYGRQMLVFTLRVTEGELAGSTEIINRVIYPAHLTNVAHAEVIKQAQETGVSEEKVKRKLEAELKADLLAYLEKTYRILNNLGVDISSREAAQIFINAVHQAIGQKVEWTIFNGGGKYRTRQCYISDSYKGEKPAGGGKVQDNLELNLFEGLPSGDDIPLGN